MLVFGRSFRGRIGGRREREARERERGDDIGPIRCYRPDNWRQRRGDIGFGGVFDILFNIKFVFLLYDDVA